MHESANRDIDADVVVVGAGPVGSALALDLARRGVRVLVLEREPAPRRLPKMERCNARTMEIFRRLGLAETIRAASRFTPIPMDVYVASDLSQPPLLHLPYPSVPQAQERIRATRDGSLPLEPQQLISQYTLEPILRAAAVGAGAEVRCGLAVDTVVQDEDGVTAIASSPDGEGVTIRARWLVGADGGVSTVRKQLGIALEGDGRIRRLRQVFFRSEQLFEAIPCGRGRHYYLPEGALTVQDDLQHFVLNFLDWNDADDPLTRLRAALGLDVDLEILHEADWHHHLLLATGYRSGRVFLAGDAAHLVIPQGGLGMNTGIGDAIDLSWKLAAAVHGWGGDLLLESYEAERRQVGWQNREASRAAAGGVAKWRAAVTGEIRDLTPAGEAIRQRVAELACEGQRIGHELLGIEAGYQYSHSPVIFREDGAENVSVPSHEYVPSAAPGARLPHVWLDDGTPLHDALGPDFTLLSVGQQPPDAQQLTASFADCGAPLSVVHLPNRRAQEVYGAPLLLIRPDLHVVWRGQSLPLNTQVLAAAASGNADARAVRTAVAVGAAATS
ncbi:MAG: 2-polyprenyl-6-methoxyphenol hydroxylase-like oxidoreductase [Frankiales bacterium]|jgi:2-polyprenyl-6-methoxyphenol hydroxylase-like FAD-dependent oxidoreductase|nr:2-polyprenyl-6-methoxyphenol hydroxylase-like oxidoreductase [Frankiales bacterium]